MPVSKRRLMSGVSLCIGLIAAALMLRLALEWRQALDDIDAMIVTPVTLPVPTVDSTSSQAALSTMFHSGNDSNTQNQAGAVLSVAVAQLQPTIAPEPTPEPPLPDSPLNILLLGTDARPGDNAATRTDALILIHLDRQHNHVSMLSIPRDLWVTYPGQGEGRINAAYATGEHTYGPGGGAALTKATVGRLLGLKVDYFALVNFQGFSSLIDLVGGITIDVPAALYDPDYPTEDYNTIEVRFRKGRQRMDGERALIYARTRHADSDFGRNQRQQLVLMAIFDRVRERGLLQQLTSLDDYTGALRDYVRTDMPRSTMLDLARWGRSLDQNDVRRYAIDSSMIVELDEPATFVAEPKALKRIVGKLTGTRTSSAGGQ